MKHEKRGDSFFLLLVAKNTASLSSHRPWHRHASSGVSKPAPKGRLWIKASLMQPLQLHSSKGPRPRHKADHTSSLESQSPTVISSATIDTAQRYSAPQHHQVLMCILFIPPTSMAFCDFVEKVHLPRKRFMQAAYSLLENLSFQMCTNNYYY